jgi:hypothetical protein
MAHKFNQRQNTNSEPSRKRLLLPSATVQSRAPLWAVNQPRDGLSLDGRCSVFEGADERKERHVSGIPAVHGSVTDTAPGIAPLPERQTSGRHFVFSPAIGTFEDYHFQIRCPFDEPLDTT